MIRTFKSKKGYTLIESLVYIGIFVIVSSAIVGLILSVLETNKKVTPLNLISQSAVSSLESMTREIRGAKSLNFPNSVLSDPNGALEINSLDIDGNLRTVRYYLSAGAINLDENGVNIGPLTSANVAVSSLIFNIASSSDSILVKIQTSLSAGNGQYQKTEQFYSSVQIRTDN